MAWVSQMQHFHIEANWPCFAQFRVDAAPGNRVFWAIGVFFVRATFYTKWRHE